MKLCGYTEADSGFAINVSQYSQLTVSTQSIQERYRVGCVDSLPAGAGNNTTPVFNGVNKDGTNDSITVDTTDYNYLIINATNLSVIQVEEGSVATEYEPYTGGQPSPSPDYPQPITTLTFDKITRCGKNLFDYNDVNAVADEIEAGDNGWITAKFDNTEGSTIKFVNYFTNKIILKPNHKYNVFLEVKAVEGDASIVLVSYYRPLNIDEYNKNEGQFITSFTLNFKDIKNGNIYNKICVTDNTFKDLKISLRSFIQYNPGKKGAITFRLSLLEDTSVTPQNFIYEPYQGQTYDIDLQGNEMVEIPNGVKDELIIDKYGNVSLIKNVGKVIYTNTNNFSNNGQNNKRIQYLTPVIENIPLSYGDQLDNIFKSNVISSIYVQDGTSFAGTTATSKIRVSISREILNIQEESNSGYLNALNELLQLLNESGNPFTIYYPLAEPQPISLGKLSDIITTLNGTNNISINGNIPTTISTTYALDIKKYIDNNLAEISSALIKEG